METSCLNGEKKMNYIEKVEIKKFWGDKDISFEFNSDINFLIGVNGSGKTTVINMVAAALSADFHALDKLPFEKLLIVLNEVNGNRKPSIEIIKRIKEQSPFAKILVRIKDKASDIPVEYPLDDIEEDRFYRVNVDDYYQEYPDFTPRFSRTYKKVTRDVKQHLKNIVKVSWLSIHRTTAPYLYHEDRSFESSIDRKLKELSEGLLRYFSLLDNRANKETEKFQQTIFLSLVSDESEEEIFLLLKKLDFVREQKALTEIFRLFKLEEKRFRNKIEKHFKLSNNAFEKFSKRNTLNLKDFSVLIGTKRIHSIVQEWNKLTDMRNKIYEHRNVFLNVINPLMQKKKIQINNRNELEAITESGKIFPLKFLSSGEKQLLIFLGEALLQQSVPWIYIADEPELSLHVTWQESLVRNLKKVNPNAQIIFATHSPDIVSTYSDSVFDMEKVLS